jgi:UDP-N-acetylmuramate dehydrogenase
VEAICFSERKNSLAGIDLIKEDAYNIWVRASAGVIWHSFVLFCVEKNFAGLENLSLIPGQVGAAPMQNIGAYGVEVADTCAEVEAIHLNSGQAMFFKNENCEFGYRESIFKHKYKNELLISAVTFKLNKIFKPQISYGDIRLTLEEMRVGEITMKAVSDAVIKIRSSKLPDPKIIGNAGSFFKNPVISKKRFNVLIQKYPLMPNFPQPNEMIKLAAGWLIEG